MNYFNYQEYETNCPGCDRLWVYQDPINLTGEDGVVSKLHNPYPKRCECGMQIVQLRSIRHVGSKISSLEKIMGKYSIRWNFDTNYCEMFDTPAVADHRPVIFGKKMPWLNLDITLDQFKIYLTFS